MGKQQKSRKGRGRPSGTGIYDGGHLRFAVTKEMAEWLKKFQIENGFVTLSDAAREVVKRAMQATR